MKTDLIIIGAGPGGYETALYAASHGLFVVLIESSKVGGTCLNEGCIPTKALCRNAEVFYTLSKAEEFGITVSDIHLNFSKVMERKNKVVDTLRSGVEILLNNNLITRVQGKASIKDSHTVIVPGATNVEGTSVDEEYAADNIIVATGSVVKYLPVEGISLPNVLNSTDLLNIDHIPNSLCIIGGGVIGLEFASIFNSFGCKVTVVEFCKDVLPNFDADIAKRLRLALKARGITFFTGAGVTAIKQTADSNALEVFYEQRGKQLSTIADSVLMAVGRGANTAGLNLDTVDVHTDRHGIVVDDNMQTNIPSIYAIGDVNGRCMLAHAATFQGKRAINHILGHPDMIRLDIIPSAVFTSPEAAMVGLTEDQCKSSEISIIEKKAFFRANGKALAMGETEGMVKLLVSETNDAVVGCHIFGPHAADLIQEVAALMNKNCTLSEFRNIIHGHPTLGEVIQTACE
jgi:dihydrolipoamide dehydrogenase